MATAQTVAGVRGGRSTTDLLPLLAPRVRSGAQSLAFYTLRHLGWALAVRASWTQRPPPAWADALVLSALCLLRAQDVPEEGSPRYAAHTVVDQAVRAAKRQAPAQAKMVNALLRRYVRESAAALTVHEGDEVACWNHPAWWIARVRTDWPQDWQAILEADNQRAPLALRVNARWGTAQDYARCLLEQGVAARVLGTQTVVLDDSLPVAQLPGFAQGWCSVQDVHAQLAAPLLLGLQAGVKASTGEGSSKLGTMREEPVASTLTAAARVLDACCAPGGKTAHLLELSDAQVLGLDVDAQRLQRVADNLQRLKLKAQLLAADARRPDTWWDGQAFDAILLDAPCSASGIVRRHPDVRWLRRAADLPMLARIQEQLLDALWPLLKPTGRLLYCTCSVFRQEGEERIEAFLQRHPQAFRMKSPGHMLAVADNGRGGGALTTLHDPAEHAGGGDGFYYALLAKR